MPLLQASEEKPQQQALSATLAGAIEKIVTTRKVGLFHQATEATFAA